MLKRIGTLEIEQDLQFEKKYWAVQRAGYIGMATFAVAAALGFTGTGPLNEAVVRADGFQVEYKRFARVEAPTTLSVVLPASASSQDRRFWLSRDYIETFQIEQITPQPVVVTATGDRLVYFFRTDQQPDPIKVTIQMKPTSFGAIRGAAGGTGSSGEARLRQFVYP